jgi:hypothetical protein
VTLDWNGEMHWITTTGGATNRSWPFSGVPMPFQPTSGMAVNNSIMYITGMGVWITSSDGSTASGWLLNRSQYIYNTPGTSKMYVSNLYGYDLQSNDSGNTWVNDSGQNYYSVISTAKNIIGIGNGGTMKAAPFNDYNLNDMTASSFTGVSPPSTSGTGTVFAANTLVTGGRLVYVGSSGYIAYTNIN